MRYRRYDDNPHKLKFNRRLSEYYRKTGYWGDATLLDCWNNSVLRFPDKTAVVDAQGASYSFFSADEQASRLAGFLAASGVEPGDRVSFQIPGWAEFLPVYIACLKAGAVLNPIPTNLRFKDALYILSECGSKALFIPYRHKRFFYNEMAERLQSQLPELKTVVTVDKFRESAGLVTLEDIIASSRPLGADEINGIQAGVSADDLMSVLFTSGSEGRPKGVMLTHNNVVACETAFAAHFGITMNDVMLMPAPITHATGYLHGLTMPFLVGATSVIQDKFNAELTLKLLEQHRCTVSMASEPFLHDMICVLRRRRYDVSSLRFFACGGSAVSQTLIEEAMKAGIVTCNVYGSTESVGHVGVLPDMGMDKILFTSGSAFPGVEVRVVDKNRRPVPPGVEGEEASRGPQVFMGYLNRPELTAGAIDEDGWYYSGDLCVMDEDGCVRITGRIKDVIIRGGENISSLEVENILLRHPGIREAAVVAMPDPRLTEKACAYLVLEDSCASLKLEELVEFLLGQDIAKHKFPERIEVVKKLPRTASGKVRKGELRKDVADKIARECAI